MSEVTVNDLPATRVSLLLPRVGVWSADVEVDSDEALTGAVTLSIQGRTWRGVVLRGAVYEGTWRGRLVGGAGGLTRSVEAVAQRGSTLALALADVLRAAGETLAATSGDLSAVAPLWHRFAAPAADAVADVARAAGYAWRFLPDGTLWMGAETWPTVAPTDPPEVISETPEVGRVVLFGDAAYDVAPGVTLSLPDRDPVRVGCVEHQVSVDDARTVLLAEPSTEPAGRLLAALTTLVARLTRRIDRVALYPARVVSQAADGTLDVVPDDPRLPAASGVPIRAGLPGVRVTVPAGARVLLTYAAGDPRWPVAALWELGTVTQLAVNGGTRKTARDGESVARSDAFGTWITNVTSAINSLTTPTTITAPVGAIGAVDGGASEVRLP